MLLNLTALFFPHSMLEPQVSQVKPVTIKIGNASTQKINNVEVQLPKLLLRSNRYFSMANSLANGYLYGYAPTIIKEDQVYHTFYCSTSQSVESLDVIRYIWSTNGVDWSKPEIILSPKPNIDVVTKRWRNRAACDPSLVYYKGYYYLYYSNNHQTAPELRDEKTSAQTTISVARSDRINGKYLIYTKRGTWEADPIDVQDIILPQVERYGSPGSYGAGQQTVLAKDGVIFMWYTDDSVRSSQDSEAVRTYFLRSSNPVRWQTKPLKTNILGLNSFDIKYDQNSKHFLLIGIRNQHTERSFLVKTESLDGIMWSNPKTIIPEREFPNFAHNNGVSSDNQGQLLAREDPIVGFGAPYNLRRNDEWGRWDLFGIRVKNLK
jgi:hypothetical protein